MSWLFPLGWTGMIIGMYLGFLIHEDRKQSRYKVPLAGHHIAIQIVGTFIVALVAVLVGWIGFAIYWFVERSQS